MTKKELFKWHFNIPDSFQFFTSKPLLLGTEVVTSKSVEDGGTTLLKKQGRMEEVKRIEKEVMDDMEEIFHPEDQPSRQTLLDRMVLVHKNMRKIEDPTTTAPTPATTTRVPDSTSSVTDVPSKILDNVKIFKRYHIPAEVKISHSLKYGG